MTMAVGAPAVGRIADTQAMRVGILGVSGYSGTELLRLLAAHPFARVVAAASRQFAGQPLVAACPGLATAGGLVLDDDLADPGAWADRGVQVVFAALPHGAFAARARRFVDAGIRVVDLSADFRLRDAAEYQRRYGLAHPDPALLERATYGLTEWAGDALAAARLVANPGCYATAILLATLPAVAAGLSSGAPIVVNALSGVSGAGRSPSLATHFVECGEGAAPYKVGEEHAHLGEIQQALRRSRSDACIATGDPAFGIDDATVVFNPHLVPMARGILATVALPLAVAASTAELADLYRERYAGHAFVRVLDGAALPETRFVRGSNRCDIALRAAAGGRLLLAYAAIDNLGKGAAGQAIQNWNRMQGWPETTGLPLDGWST
jgi:N-acetyl-gamma-glutamyl-phosphate reductase